MTGLWGLSGPSVGRPLGLGLWSTLPFCLHLQVPPFAFLKALLLVLGLGLWTTHGNRHVSKVTEP